MTRKGRGFKFMFCVEAGTETKNFISVPVPGLALNLAPAADFLQPLPQIFQAIATSEPLGSPSCSSAAATSNPLPLSWMITLKPAASIVRETTTLSARGMFDDVVQRLLEGEKELWRISAVIGQCGSCNGTSRRQRMWMETRYSCAKFPR